MRWDPHLDPEQWNTSSLNRLLADRFTADGSVAGRSVSELVRGYQAELTVFKDLRRAFLIYPAVATP